MWINQKDYTALVDKAARHEARADWLLTRVNQLELELGHVRMELTGRPQPVPTFRKESTPPPESIDTDAFEDLGDELARKYGVDDVLPPPLVLG